jgi:hypothetical protein
LSAAGVLLLGWLGFNREDLSSFPEQYFLGGLMVVMIVGEISSLWRARIRRERTAQHYMDQRTEQLIRQHYLLRLSHDQLEQELIGRPVSMRDASACSVRSAALPAMRKACSISWHSFRSVQPAVWWLCATTGSSPSRLPSWAVPMRSGPRIRCCARRWEPAC